MSHRIPISLAASAVFVVAAAGCGGGLAHLSKKAYEAKLQAIGSRMAKATQAAYAPLTAQLSKRNPEKCSSQGLSVTCEAQAGTLPRAQTKRIERLLVSAWDRAASEVAALKPPSDAAADNRKLAAGIKATANLFAVSVKLREPRLAPAMKQLTKAPVFRVAAAAVKDLERKGYKLGAFSSDDGRDQNSNEGTTSPPPAQVVKPVPFALVSKSGRQAATDLNASSCRAKASAGSLTGGCSEPLYSEPSTGPIPNGLSVVRPGERVMFTIPDQASFANLVITKLCHGFDLSHLPTMRMLSGNAWAVHVRPGNYVASISFSFRRNGAPVDESGIVGLLVSTSKPVGVTYSPHCR